ncbi:related to GPI mannosyltransferase 2 [Cephalotrichum gorgonifer]|uniref:GPI mannosyltransferase 2 n=1 Tax=Cephalotrichum gorgonifer TaxID=2041049 RepID=A0AAE8N3H3_9PEZI|nr:related to GPI mannosyltransferase 2 [Cephalotrichum gorgonifer]
MAPTATTERLTLTKAFLAWKAFLLALVLASSFAPSYDSSTSLALGLPPDHPHASSSPSTPLTPTTTLSLADVIASRLTRWDAIYFTSSAHRGYIHEQEWAFGPGLPFLVSRILTPLSALLGLDLPRTQKTAALLSIAAATASHLIAVLLLHALTRRLLPRRRGLALTAGLLHVVSPAGLFLSAPYAESLCACLSFGGYLVYLSPELVPAPAPLRRPLSLVLSGALFGLATTCRTNGILSGLVFAVELISTLQGLWAGRTAGSALPRAWRALPVLVPTILGGILVALGSVVPQAAAYLRYCSGSSGSSVRPWCQELVPSIYNFVQAHYWNTGFLRYWTLPNAPLFLLAIPMLTILFVSSYTTSLQVLPSLSTSRASRLFLSMSLAQALIALLTLTSYHVQIITRLSCAYPVWYIWLASALSPPDSEPDSKDQAQGESRGGGEDASILPPGASGRKYAGAIVKYMVMYASIQGVLFATFLPPA